LRDSTVLSHVTDLAPKLCPEKAPSDQRYNVGA